MQNTLECLFLNFIFCSTDILAVEPIVYSRSLKVVAFSAISLNVVFFKTLARMLGILYSRDILRYAHVGLST